MAGGNKVFWSTTCPTGEHGTKYAGAYIVKVAKPKAHKGSKHGGCPNAHATKSA